jgi:hypothetical protein
MLTLLITYLDLVDNVQKVAELLVVGHEYSAVREGIIPAHMCTVLARNRDYRKTWPGSRVTHLLFTDCTTPGAHIQRKAALHDCLPRLLGDGMDT